MGGGGGVEGKHPHTSNLLSLSFWGFGFWVFEFFFLGFFFGFFKGFFGAGGGGIKFIISPLVW